MKTVRALALSCGAAVAATLWTSVQPGGQWQAAIHSRSSTNNGR